MVESLQELEQIISGVIAYLPETGEIYLLNKERVWADDVIDRLIEVHLFTGDDGVRQLSGRMISEIARQMDVPLQTLTGGDTPSSERQNFMPIFYLPVITYDTARAVFRVVRKSPPMPVGFAISDNNNGDKQTAEEYAAEILSAAMKERIHEGGADRFRLVAEGLQVDPGQYDTDPDSVVESLNGRISDLLEWGFTGFRLDIAPLVDPQDHASEEGASRAASVWAHLVRALAESTDPEVARSVGMQLPPDLSGNPAALGALTKALKKGVDNLEIPEVEAGSPITCPETLQIGIPASEAPGSGNQVSLLRVREFIDPARESLPGIGFSLTFGDHLREADYPELREAGVIEIHFRKEVMLNLITHSEFPENIRDAIRESGHRGNGSSARSARNLAEPDLWEDVLAEFRQDIWRMDSQRKRRIYTALEKSIHPIFNPFFV